MNLANVLYLEVDRAVDRLQAGPDRGESLGEEPPISGITTSDAIKRMVLYARERADHSSRLRDISSLVLGRE